VRGGLIRNGATRERTAHQDGGGGEVKRKRTLNPRAEGHGGREQNEKDVDHEN